MIKAFGLTALFWSLFTITNSITDSILFHQGSPWYRNDKLWHQLKYCWIGFAVATGWFGHQLHLALSGSEYIVYGVLLLWFLVLRWIIFETLLEKWSKLC